MGNFKFDKDVAKKLFAECTGTAIAITLGCSLFTTGTIITIQDNTAPAIVWGFAYLTAVQIFAFLSGAHLNPAVSGTAAIVGVMEWKMMLFYMLAQFIGAFIGIALSFAVAPSTTNLCLSYGSSEMKIFGVELFATIFLLFTYCAAWDTRSENAYDTLPLRVGFIIAALSFATNSISGCHLNFFRTFVAVLMNGKWEILWPYFVAHLIAACAVGCLWRFLVAKEKPEPMT